MATLQTFDYKVGKKPAATNGRAQFSTDYDAQRENVLSFDGNNDDITVPHSSDFNLGTSGTLMAWVYIDRDISGIEYIMNKFSAGTSQVSMSVAGGKLQALFYPSVIVTTAVDVPKYQWVHIAFTYNGSRAKVFYNGVAVLDEAKSGGITENTNALSIGQRSNNSQYWEGLLADVRWYSNGVSDEEVFALYNNNTQPDDTNLEGHWLLDEGTGTTATDSSANSNDGTITGATWETDTDFASSIANWVNKDNEVIDDVGAYEFDGVDDRITISTSLANGQEEVMMAWIKTTETSNNWLMADANSSFSDMRRGLYVKDGTFNGWVFDGTGKSLDSGVIVNDGKWHHVAQSINLNTSTRKLYVDGVLRTSDSNLDTVNSYNDFVIGGTGTGGSFFTGLISDARIYSEEMLESDFWNLYAYSTEPDDTNLDGHWKMNGNALDATANDNDGTVTGAINTTDWNEIPQIGHSFLTDDEAQTSSFDGVNDYILTTYTSQLDDFTISAWFKYDDSGNSYERIVDKSFSTGFWLGRQSGTNTWGGGILENISPYGDYVTFDTPNVWAHLVMTRSGTTKKIYLNGELKSTTTVSTSPISSTTLNIGSRYDNSSDHFGGNIANVAIFNDALTDAEIETLFLQGYVPAGHDHLVSYWPLAGDYEDKVGSNNGTNSGSTLVDDIYRPQPESPVQQTIDISALGETDSFRYRTFFDSKNTDRAFALDSVEFVYSDIGVWIPKIVFY